MQSIRDTGTADGDPNASILFDQDDDGIKIANGWIAAGEAKGFDLYFKNYLQSLNNFTDEERELIQSLLPYLRDWYVQAGTSGMVATDTLNRGAFMLGGNGSDTLVGGNATDLLVGNLGADTLTGGLGNDYLLGGAGIDTYKYQTGEGLDTILDSDGHLYVDAGSGRLLINGNSGNRGNAMNDSDWRVAA